MEYHNLFFMKKRFLIIVSILYCLAISGQDNLSGNYYNEAGVCLNIKQDSFKLIMPNAARNGYYSDIIAEGDLKYIDKSFVELNSISPFYIIGKNIEIKQFRDPTVVKDSLKLTFSFLYSRPLNVYVFTDDFKTYELEYSKHRKDIMLPINTNTITFSVSPRNFIPNTPDGLHCGILAYSSVEYEIEKGINHIMITISAIDDSFFEKYYIKGEYAKISKDSITWKGDVFVKKK